MNKSYIIKEIYSGMRIDRWIRNNIASLPQSLIEKSLRKGKIKVNIKKVNSSYKLKKGDKINFFNFTFEINKNKEVIKNDENGWLFDNYEELYLILKKVISMNPKKDIFNSDITLIPYRFQHKNVKTKWLKLLGISE